MEDFQLTQWELDLERIILEAKELMFRKRLLEVQIKAYKEETRGDITATETATGTKKVKKTND